MSLRVTAVTPLEQYRLRHAFSDASVRDTNLSYLLHGSLGEPLVDLDYFRQVRVDDEAGTIVWPNGLDPDPYVLHGDYSPARSSTAEHVGPVR